MGGTRSNTLWKPLSADRNTAQKQIATKQKKYVSSLACGATPCGNLSTDRNTVQFGFCEFAKQKKKLAYVSALARCVFKVAVDQTFEDVCVYSIERCV